MRVIGIDPGQNGAVAVLEDRKVQLLIPMPTLPSGEDRVEVDPVALSTALLCKPDLIVIEKVNAQPAWGASSSARATVLRWPVPD